MEEKRLSLRTLPKDRDPLRLCLLFCGCFFLFDPFAGSFDLLPDIIGALLLLAGIRKAAFFERKLRFFETKMKSFAVLGGVRIAVALCVLLSDFFPNLLSAEAAEAFTGLFDPTMRLTYSLVFSVLDCVILLPAFSAFFDGLEYVYMRNTPDEDVSEEALSLRRNTHVLTYVFFVIRSLAGFAPMLTALVGQTGIVSSGKALSYESIYLLLSVLSWVLAFLLGLAWLWQMRKYLAVFTFDGAFEETVEDRYQKEILPDDYLWNTIKARRYGDRTTYSLLLLLGAPISSYYLLPFFLWGLISLSAIKQFSLDGDRKKNRTLCYLYTGVGVLAYAAMFLFSSRFGVAFDPLGQEGWLPFYIPAACLRACLSVCFLLVCNRERVLFCRFLEGAVGLRGGARTDGRRATENRIRTELTKKENLLFALEALIAVVGAVSYAAFPFVGIAWTAELGLVFCAVIYSAYLTGRLTEETEMAL